MRNLLKLQAKAFALTVVLLICITSMLSAQKIAIIDAGSSGSRLYVYEIKDNGEKIDVLFPALGQDSSSKGRALSSVANHQDSVNVFLSTMTGKYMKGDKTVKIPLYVLATAGMRMLPEKKADSIYEKMNSKTIALNGFRLETAMTISGKYEGFYAWIAANYKNGKLGFSTSTSQKTLTYTGVPYGILEIGGASMQIAFAVNKPCRTCISRKGFSNIYSKSYLGGGVDQIYDKYKTQKSPAFTEKLNEVNNLYDEDLKFIGLGKPIGITLDDAKSNTFSGLRSYANLLPNNDSLKNFHPWMNAHYIAWVVDILKLDGKLAKPANESDWTEGAALDILINKEMPEKFDYQAKN